MSSLPRTGLLCSLAFHGALVLATLPHLARPLSQTAPSRSLELTLLAPVSHALTATTQKTPAPEAPSSKAFKASPSAVASPAPSPAKALAAPQSPPSGQPTPAATATAETPAAHPVTPPIQAAPSEPALMQRYARLLTERLGQRTDYPPLAAMRGWQGLVHIRITLSRHGDLLQAQVANSSGFTVLDQHALQRVKDVTPLPALAGTPSGDPLQMVIPVQYRLERG